MATDLVKAREWVRYWKACLSLESRAGALRGAMRDGVLPQFLNELGITNVMKFAEAICDTK